MLLVGAALSAPLGGVLAQEVDPPPSDPAAQDSASREGAAQDSASREGAPADSVEEKEPSVRVGYGDKGFWVGTADGNNLLHAEIRLQFRYSYPFDVNPVDFQDFEGPDQSTFKINRARIKIGGHGYRPWLKYYFEYELAAGALLDLRFMLEKLPELSLKVGQWKVHYNRERIISSGKQQMVERSIITRPFTVDRQTGVDLYGRLKAKGAADFSYWAGVFTGRQIPSS